MISAEELKQIHLEASTAYGLMGLTTRQEPLPDKQSFEAIDKAIEESDGKAIFNVGEFYGPDFNNLKLVRRYFTSYPHKRDRVIISCKGGMENATLTPKGDYASMSNSIDTCLKEIGGPIEIFEPARIDVALAGSNCYAAETFDCIVDYIKKGKIGGISLSEVNAEQIRAINSKYGEYLCCVEVELSLISREILSNGVVDTCNELGIPVICYSPLGRGLLSGAIKCFADIPEGDFRQHFARFQDDSLKQNLKVAQFLQDEIVSKRDDGITLSQAALAWIRSLNSKYPNTRLIPLPGGTTASKVEQNYAIFELTQEEIHKIETFINNFEIRGGRVEHIKK